MVRLTQQSSRNVQCKQIHFTSYVDYKATDKTICFITTSITKENRIFIKEEFTIEKSIKRPFCCTVTAGVLHLCYITFWALEHHFIENLSLHKR